MIIEGRNAVSEAAKAGTAFEKVYAEEGAERTGSGRELLAALRSSYRVNVVPKAVLDRMSPTKRHQGFLAVAPDYAYCEPEDLLKIAEVRGEPPFLVMLCGVEDPHNLGSVIRVCECAGAHGVIIPKHSGAPVNETVARVSAGALSHIKVARATNLNRTIEDLQKRGVWVYGAEAEGEDLYAADLTGPVCLVVGSEGSGIPRLTREACDKLVRIPMFGKVNSLNASVAAGVVLYEAVRQRRG